MSGRMTAVAKVRQAARQRVNALVRSGTIPHPRDSFCFDCRGEAAQYDHHRGYEGEAALDVQPVCVKCHVARGVARDERMQIRHDQRMPGRMYGVGGAIWRARLRLGISRDELASRAGYKSSSIRDLEACWWKLRPTTIDRLALALGVPISDLTRADRRTEAA